MKKRKGKKIKKRIKKVKIKDQEIHAQIINRMKELGLPLDQVKFHESSGNEIKMSEVILKIAEPYIKKYWNNDKRIHTIISLTIMVWNITLFPDGKRENLYDMLVDQLPQETTGEEVAAFMESLDILIDRKKEYFPDIKRFIMNYKIFVSNGNITLNITSVPIVPKVQGSK